MTTALAASAWLAPASEASAREPAAGSEQARTVTAKFEETARTGTITVVRYDSGKVPANTPSGFTEQCLVQTFIRWPEVHGWVADHIIYTRNGARAFDTVTPPFQDEVTNNNHLGSGFVLPPGMHQRIIESITKTTNGPFSDCSAEENAYRASLSPTAEITYYRTEECLSAQEAVSSAQAKVKAATKALKHAGTAAEKRKAKKKLKKAKKKLDKAKDKVSQLC
jgi:hypothetical protein